MDIHEKQKVITRDANSVPGPLISSSTQSGAVCAPCHHLPPLLKLPHPRTALVLRIFKPAQSPHRENWPGSCAVPNPGGLPAMPNGEINFQRK